MNVNKPIDYLSPYSFGNFCCRVKQGKRLSEFLQKYTDSGTKTTHLAGYNILVFKYIKISAGLPLLFIGAIREQSSKIRYCIIWRCLHLMFSTTNVSEKWNAQGFERMLSYEQYLEEKSHIVQIPSVAPSFIGIWAIWSPLKIQCYTCMSFKTCWSRLYFSM